MDPVLIGALAIVIMIALIGIGIPIAAAIGIVALVSYAMLDSWANALNIFGSVTAETFTNRDIATIPLFLFMGGFATAGGISADLFRLAYAFVGHYKGGLAVSTVFGCAGFGAVCGSSAATAATMTHVALPEMRKRRYKPGLAAGSIAAAGTLGILIPPSIAMILYCYLTQAFILEMFIAALVPGLITVILYWITIAIVVKRDPEAGPAGERLTWVDRWTAVKESWAAILLAGLVAGGIYTGTLTVVEGAAAGAILSALIAFLRRRLTWRIFFDVLLDTASSTGMIYVIIIGASVLGFTMSVSTIPEVLVSAIKDMNVPPVLVIFMLLGMYLISGSIFESFSALVITTPFVYPLVIGLGYDPLWWGILMVVMIEIGQITPPIGMNVFVVQGMARDVPMRTVFAGIVPFLYADIVRIGLLVFFPALTLWLPQVLR
jgi:C4-dicarboxylate transporter, DctM subunit